MNPEEIAKLVSLLQGAGLTVTIEGEETKWGYTEIEAIKIANSKGEAVELRGTSAPCGNYGIHWY